MKTVRTTITLSSTSPPEEFRIWPFGVIDTTKGQFLFDSVSADSVMKAAALYGNKLTFDYNHAAVVQVGDTPSAGTFHLEVREDGLWAIGCEWTPNASQRLSAKEYLYFSPAFNVDDENRITELINIALTNLPATRNMTPLVAGCFDFRFPDQVLDRRVNTALAFDEIHRALAQALRERFGYDPYLSEVFDEYAVFLDGGTFAIDYTVDGFNVQLVGEPREVARQYIDIPGGKTMNKALLLSLGLHETATEADAVITANTLVGSTREITTLTSTTTLPEALGVIRAWKAKADRADGAERELATLSQAREAEQREVLLSQAQRDGKIPPAQADFWRTQPLETLSAFVKTASPVVDTANHHTDESQKPIHLSDDAARIATMLGVKPEDMAVRAARGV